MEGGEVGKEAGQSEGVGEGRQFIYSKPDSYLAG